MIEISARQTGKSTRLVSKINELITFGCYSDRIQLIAPNIAMGQRIKNLIPTNKSIIICNKPSDVEFGIPTFIDEFDFVNWLTPEIAEKCDIRYACTTSSKVRTLDDCNDSSTFFGALLKRFNGNFVSFTCVQMLKNVRRYVSASDIEFSNRFIKIN